MSLDVDPPVPMVLVRHLDGSECWEMAAEYRRNPGYGTFVIRPPKGVPIPDITMPAPTRAWLVYLEVWKDSLMRSRDFEAFAARLERRKARMDERE